jgi:hypothetical protein
MPDWHTLVTEPHIVLFARTTVGLILLIAGIAKIGDRHQVADMIRNYQLLPSDMTKLLGLALPLVEIAIAVSLLAGVLMPWSALAAISLFLLFSGAVAINLLRGRREIACGCFGTSEEQHLSWLIVVRNIALAGLAALSIGYSETLLDLLARISVIETAATVLMVSTALVLWWLGGRLMALWHLPDSQLGSEDSEMLSTSGGEG